MRNSFGIISTTSVVALQNYPPSVQRYGVKSRTHKSYDFEEQEAVPSKVSIFHVQMKSTSTVGEDAAVGVAPVAEAAVGGGMDVHHKRNKDHLKPKPRRILQAHRQDQ